MRRPYDFSGNQAFMWDEFDYQQMLDKRHDDHLAEGYKRSFMYEVVSPICFWIGFVAWIVTFVYIFV